MVEIKIGRNPNNDIVLDHPTVSGWHAIIEIGDEVRIRDLNSSNGTSINHVPIEKDRINKNDILTFGEYSIGLDALEPRIHEVLKLKKTDFSKEYRDVLDAFKIYQLRRDKILNPSKWPILFRIGITMGAIIILIVTDIVPPRYQIYLLTIIGLIALLPSLMAPSQSARNHKLDLLRLEYEDKLVCPKCGNKMIGQSLVYWQNKNKCLNERCNATY